MIHGRRRIGDKGMFGEEAMRGSHRNRLCPHAVDFYLQGSAIAPTKVWMLTTALAAT